MKIDVLFFGPAQTWCGVDRAAMELAAGATVRDLKARLTERYAVLKPALPTLRLAVNHAFVPDQTVLGEGDEVAVIPPVSGGAGQPGGSGSGPGEPDTVWIALQQEPIDTAAVRAFAGGDPTLGGIVVFDGVCRIEHDAVHGRLVHLDYEAYPGMAEKRMVDLADHARTAWPVGRLAMVHRTGVVKPAEVSVSIAVACPRRRAAFEACRWLIDTLKSEVPIWKKDVFEDGFTRWVDPTDRQKPGEL